MAGRLILFGGGDAGGIYITSDGIKPVPPFDPRVRLQIRGLSALVRGAGAFSPAANREMETHLAKTTHTLVAELQGLVGDLAGENTVVVADNDGDGFSCGSTGKPYPFHGPRPRVGINPVANGNNATLQERATLTAMG